MDFTDPAVFGRLEVADSNGWATVTLPKGSTVYRADHAGKKDPATGVPNFFSDKQSIKPYMRGKSEVETVSSFTTTSDTLLFVMSADNIASVRGIEEHADFINDVYTVPIEEEDGTLPTVIHPSKPLKVTKDGKVLEYANRRMAEIVCKIGFGGWVALPDTDVKQISLDVAWFAQTGQYVHFVKPYAPEIVLCDWKAATTGGRRKYYRKTRRRRSTRKSQRRGY